MTPRAAPGAIVNEDGSVSFLLWAPRCESVELVLVDDEQTLAMEADGDGYWTLTTGLAKAGARYLFRVAGGEFPDPASRFQPDGVHGPSQVVDFSTFSWTDGGFESPALAELVIYELHVGTFTPEGTFAAAADRLSELSDLGVTAVEVMPIAEFAGERNWGYDGVSLYAAQSSYGGPVEFARFVDRAHSVGLAVLLDVVFNHFGPEGNYSGQFGAYTTDRYRTPWGDAINVDGKGSDEVRRFFLGCLEHWMRDCHVDGFRLDAVHEIHDESAVPFLLEASTFVRAVGRETGRRRLVIAESDLNDRRVVEPGSSGGLGMHAAWADDFHHAVHAHLTGERNGYYADFGSIEHIARAVEDGWSYRWDYSPSRGRRHGNDPTGLPGSAFVFCTQNHDQVGNRMLGERLGMLAGPDAERVARALLLLLPYVPLLFMGQEYGEQRPFLYFVDHTDPALLEATRQGRAREFSAFHAEGTPPDPGSAGTRDRSVLARPADGDRTAAQERALTADLIALRRRYDCFRPAAEHSPEVERLVRTRGAVLLVGLSAAESVGLIAVNLGAAPSRVVPARVLERTVFDGAASHTAPMVVCSLGDPERTGVDLDETGELHLEPWDLIAAVGPRGRDTSQR